MLLEMHQAVEPKSLSDIIFPIWYTVGVIIDLIGMYTILRLKMGTLKQMFARTEPVDIVGFIGISMMIIPFAAMLGPLPLLAMLVLWPVEIYIKRYEKRKQRSKDVMEHL